jgi:hypothetical protein
MKPNRSDDLLSIDSAIVRATTALASAEHAYQTAETSEAFDEAFHAINRADCWLASLVRMLESAESTGRLCR